MLFLIYLFSIFLLLAGFWLLVKPAHLLNWMVRYAEHTGLYAAAILVRLGLGALLIYLSSLSRFPLTILIIGWIAIAAAVVFLFMGKTRFSRMLKAIMSKVKPWGRAGGAAAILFGGFLLYSFA